MTRERRKPTRPCLITVQDHAAQVKEALGHEIIAGVGGPGDIVELWGTEGSGKTRVALGLAEALIHKRHWGPFKILKNGPVLFIESDMPEVAHGKMTEEFETAGYFRHRQLYTLPHDVERIVYQVTFDLDVTSFPYDLPEGCLPVAVFVDTWSSIFVASGGASEMHLEGVIRALVAQVRKDFPTALLFTLNHTTNSGDNGRPLQRALSPALSRIATTRYRVSPPEGKGAIDDHGRWLKPGSLDGIGKFARSGVLPRKIPLTWDWQQGQPCPLPDVKQMSAASWVHLFPYVEGLKESYSSQRQALQDLSEISGVSVAALKKAHQRDPNVVLQALGGAVELTTAEERELAVIEQRAQQNQTKVKRSVVERKSSRKGRVGTRDP